jgi:hypothetical protein
VQELLAKAELEVVVMEPQTPAAVLAVAMPTKAAALAAEVL